jgi:hypothetical protein
MGEMIEQIWVRKTSEALGAKSPSTSSGPDPQITIPACSQRHGYN